MVDAAIEEMHTNLSRFWTKTEDTLAGAGAAILMPFIQPLESFKPDGEGLESDDDDAEDATGWMRTSLQCRPCGSRCCCPFLMPLVAHKKGPPARLFQGPFPPPPHFFPTHRLPKETRGSKSRSMRLVCSRAWLIVIGTGFRKLPDAHVCVR